MSTRRPAATEALRERQNVLAAATAGNAHAQCQMGDFCRIGGEFGSVNLTEAVKWYRLAAAQGNLHAQNNLGAMCQHGMGVPVDAAEAVKWYRLAAAKDFAAAQYNLGIAYLKGIGIEANAEEALRLVTAAANGGYLMAQRDMGYMLLDGSSAAPDLAREAEFFIMAARQGDIRATGHLGDMERPLKRAAISGNKKAAWCLKQMYESALGVPRNKKESRRWGQLFVAIDNVGRDRSCRVHLNAYGNLEDDGDEPMTRASEDDPYSLEWLYQAGATVDSVDTRQRSEFLEYKAKRDAGMPTALEAAWPDDNWRKWRAA